MKIEGIIFDKDGTLIDFYKTWIPAAIAVVDSVFVDYEISESMYAKKKVLNAIGISENQVAPDSSFAWKTYDDIARDMQSVLEQLLSKKIDVHSLGNKLANYFEVMDALAEMIETKTVDTTEKNQLEQPEDCVCCNETTRSIARQLDTALPLSVRDRAVTAALELLARAKRQHENQVDLIHTEHGYQVICHISGGKMELMAITLYVPDLRQAQLVKENFQKNPQRIYSILLSSLTDNHIILKELLTDPQL